MGISFVAGRMLQSNLERDSNLAFNTDLIYLDVVGNLVGINTASPTTTLDVNGDIRSNNLQTLANLTTSIAFANTVASNANLNIVTFNSGNVVITPDLPGITKIDATNGLVIPVGNTLQRPVTPDTGTLRFNTFIGNLEIYDGSTWTSIGSAASFAITNQTIVPDGSTSSYTLNQDATASSILLTINGVGQTPDIDYTVTGNLLALSTTPLTTDIIQVRFLAGLTTVNQIVNSSGNALVTIDPSGNIILETSTTGQIYSYGNLLPVTNIAYNIGSNTLRWHSLWLSGNALTMGNIVMKNTIGNTIGFFGPDGITPATLDANAEIVADSIASGTSQVSIPTANGNIIFTVNNANIVSISSSSADIDGNLIVNGNATVGNINNNNANGIGNIGNATNYFNTVFAKATSAQYADLAEKFLADKNYEPGTVLTIGGPQQVTACSTYADTKSAGIVTTDPAYLMNASVNGITASIALAGQVPCLVVGPINKGDLLTTSTTVGYACKLNNADWKPGVVVAKSLEDCQSGLHKILVLVQNH